MQKVSSIKVFLVIISLLLLSLSSVFGDDDSFKLSEDSDYKWDSQDYIEDTSTIADIQDFIFDFYVGSPVDAWGVAIDFRTGYLLPKSFRLGITGSFFNNLDNMTDQDDKEWWQDADGNKDELKEETLFKQQQWTAIDNTLFAYFGWQFNDNINLGFELGGGTDIDDYTVKEYDYTKTYDTNGDVNANWTNEALTSKMGFGFISAGAGVSFAGDLFSPELINGLSITERVTFNIAGNGNTTGLNPTQRIVQNTYDLDEEKIQSIKSKDIYEYFGFNNTGAARIDLYFHKAFNSLGFMNMFALLVGFDYNFGFRYYSKHYSYVKTTDHVTDDFTKNTDQQNINYFLNGGCGIPIGLHVRPVNAVQMRITYTPAFNIVATKYSETDIVETEIGGVNTVVTNPENFFIDNDFNVTHSVGFRLRFVFPKVVRLTLGGEYTVTQAFTYDENWYDDNVGTTVVDGSETKFVAGVDIEKNKTLTYAVGHTINPTLELDFEIVKDLAFITIGWAPIVTLGSGVFGPDGQPNTTTEIRTTNIFNLACWNLSGVVKFNTSSIANAQK